MGKVTIQSYTTKEPITMIGYESGICMDADISDPEKNYKRGMECINNEHGRTWEFPDVYATIADYSAKAIREWYTHIGCLPTRLQGSTRYIDYSKGKGFDYITPSSIANHNKAMNEWVDFMKSCNDMISRFINEYNIPIEDSTMALPIAYETKMVDKRNFRNLVDMAHQRKCSRAYWEFRKLFKDYEIALRNYSEQWNILCDLFIPKCKYLGLCKEKKSCGLMPKKEGKYIIYKGGN